jgi:hypothetical protein
MNVFVPLIEDLGKTRAVRKIICSLYFAVDKVWPEHGHAHTLVQDSQWLLVGYRESWVFPADTVDSASKGSTGWLLKDAFLYHCVKPERLRRLGRKSVGEKGICNLGGSRRIS